jgi:glycine hydroxymethyltransferase
VLVLLTGISLFLSFSLCGLFRYVVRSRPYSGSPANFAVYTALLRPHDRIMGLDLPSGGHLTHGFYTLNKKTKERKKISATSIFFESLPYSVSSEDGLIDMDGLSASANIFKPAMIVMGASAYPREFNYERFRQIADDNGALLMMDMAHISGLVATGNARSPFDFCDIVTTTTHKSLRGPRSGMIFYKLDERDFITKINMAVFPGLQGGPHLHQIGGLCVQLKEVQSPAFHKYAAQVVSNCRALGETLTGFGYKMCSGGSDNHLQLWDLRPCGITGSKMELICEEVSISLNKNAIYGDRSALSPGGVRIGTPALTSRGFTEADFVVVAGFLHRCVEICQALQTEAGSKKLAAFKKLIPGNEIIAALKTEVKAFARSFAMPGFEMKN